VISEKCIFLSQIWTWYLQKDAFSSWASAPEGADAPCSHPLDIFPFRCITSCRVTSRRVTSCHVMLRHITSCHVMSRHITSHHVMSRHVMSRHVTSRHVASCHVMSHHVISCHIKSHHVTSTLPLMLPYRTKGCPDGELRTWGIGGQCPTTPYPNSLGDGASGYRCPLLRFAVYSLLLFCERCGCWRSPDGWKLKTFDVWNAASVQINTKSEKRDLFQSNLFQIIKAKSIILRRINWSKWSDFNFAIQHEFNLHIKTWL
jgi:hypothetical protein